VHVEGNQGLEVHLRLRSSGHDRRNFPHIRRKLSPIILLPDRAAASELPVTALG
jgi:hypothetical protein